MNDNNTSARPVYVRRRSDMLYSFIAFLLLIPFCEPNGLTGILGIQQLWNILLLIDSFALIFIALFVLKRGVYLWLYVGAFYLVILISTILNSGDVLAALTFAARMISFIILIQYYAKIHKLHCLFSSMKVMLGTYILITLFFQLVAQDIFGYTTSHNYINFLTSDNDLGYWYIPFILVVYLSNVRKSKRRQMRGLIFWSCVCLVSLIKAWSATCLIIYVACIIMLIFWKIRPIRWLTPLRSWVINLFLSVAIIFFQVQSAFEWLIVDVLHKSMTLSNRIYIWASSVNNILKKPILGYGTSSNGRMTINQVNIMGREMTYFSHNIFLEVVIQGGIIALILYFMMHFFAGRTLKRYPGTMKLKCFLNITLFALLLMQFSEFSLYAPFANLPLILCFFYRELCEEGFEHELR